MLSGERYWNRKWVEKQIRERLFHIPCLSTAPPQDNSSLVDMVGKAGKTNKKTCYLGFCLEFFILFYEKQQFSYLYSPH